MQERNKERKMISRRLVQCSNSSLARQLAAQTRFASSTSTTKSATPATAVKASSEEVKHPVSKKSEFVFNREDKYGAHNYHPLPVAIEKAKGTSRIDRGDSGVVLVVEIHGKVFFLHSRRLHVGCGWQALL